MFIHLKKIIISLILFQSTHKFAHRVISFMYLIFVVYAIFFVLHSLHAMKCIWGGRGSLYALG